MGCTFFFFHLFPSFYLFLLALSFLFFFNWRLITLQYCGGFCHTFTWIHHGCICVDPPEPPSHLFPSHPSGSSQCTSPEHPVSCIEPGLTICFTYDNIHVSMLSLKSSHSHLLPHGPKVCSLHLCLFCAQHFLINQRLQSLQSGWYPLAPGASTHKDGLGRQEILFVVHSEILHNHPNFNWLINYSFS